MKYLFPAILTYLVAVVACTTSPKEEPVEHRTLFGPSETLAKISGTPIKELHIGFGVWMRECGKCHGHVFPDDVSSETWHSATPRMAWNANITDKEQAALLKYILAVKSDAPDFNRQLEKLATESR